MNARPKSTGQLVAELWNPTGRCDVFVELDSAHQAAHARAGRVWRQWVEPGQRPGQPTDVPHAQMHQTGPLGVWGQAEYPDSVAALPPVARVRRHRDSRILIVLVETPSRSASAW